VSYIDPFGLGAVGENANSSWLSTYNSIATTVVPGQAVWNNAVSSFQNGNYGIAALGVATMLGQDALFALTLGQSQATTPLLNSTETAVDNSLITVTHYTDPASA
jgi:hypothetical protein